MVRPSHEQSLGSVTKAQVEATFGKAGMIKIRKKTKEPNVWVGPDGTEGSVTYDDPSSAQVRVLNVRKLRGCFG